MARTLIASDNFNRASLGTDWSDLNSGWNTLSIAGSVAAVYSFSTISLAQFGATRWVGSGSFSNNQYSEIDPTGFAFGGGAEAIGAGVRVSADEGTEQNGYYFHVRDDAASGGSHLAILWKVVGGTTTVLHSASVTWGDGDKISIEAEGTTIRGCKNGTPLGGSFTQTDSDLSTGKPAICGAGGSTCRATAWESGDLSAVTNAPLTIVSNQVTALSTAAQRFA
jgi:hypothetical protein